MDFFTAADVIAQGLGAERTLLNTVSSNLANAHTTRTAEGGPYKRLDPVFEAKNMQSEFAAQLGRAGGSDPADAAVKGVQVSEIRADEREGRLVYDPSHPDAQADGYVRMPNVNVVEEMVNMIEASRAYEAGVKAMGTLSGMAERAISIGK
jgi:flagellar basal-body rod protein FlgC